MVQDGEPSRRRAATDGYCRDNDETSIVFGKHGSSARHCIELLTSGLSQAAEAGLFAHHR